MSEIVTNITDPDILKDIALQIQKKNIIIVSEKSKIDIEGPLNIKYIQLNGSYKDTIKILDDELNKIKLTAAVVTSERFGMYLYSYLSAFKQLPVIYICDDKKLEPVIVNSKNIGKTKRKILEFIKGNSNSTSSEIFSGVGFKPGTSSAYVHINTLKDMQLIKEENKAYYISDLGSTFLNLIN